MYLRRSIFDKVEKRPPKGPKEMASPKGIDGDTQPELTPLRITTSSRETPAAPSKATAERKQRTAQEGSAALTSFRRQSSVLLLGNIKQ